MTVSVTGNLELGRINIEGQNYVTVKVDADGGPIRYETDAGIAEIRFCAPNEDLEGRDPNSCLRLVYLDGSPDIVLVGR